MPRPAPGGRRRKAVVNVHYLADALEAHLKNRVEGIEIAVSDEREQLLETGGGLKSGAAADRRRSLPRRQFRQSLGRRPGRHASTAGLGLGRGADGRAAAARAARPRPLPQGPGDFHMSATGKLRRRKPNRVAPFVFTGIQIVSKRLFDGETPDGPFLDQPAVGPRHRRGPLLRRRPPGPLVRHRPPAEHRQGRGDPDEVTSFQRKLESLSSRT